MPPPTTTRSNVSSRMRASERARYSGSRTPVLIRPRPPPCARRLPPASARARARRCSSGSAGATVSATSCAASGTSPPVARVAIAAIPRAVASRSAATSRGKPDRSATVCRNSWFRARPPPDPKRVRGMRRIQRLERIRDLVRDAGHARRGEVGRRRRAARAEHRDPVGGVPVRRPQTGRCRHDHRAAAAPSQAPTVRRRRQDRRVPAPPARCRRWRRTPPGHRRGRRAGCPRRRLPARRRAAGADRGRHSATGTHRCRG